MRIEANGRQYSGTASEIVGMMKMEAYDKSDGIDDYVLAVLWRLSQWRVGVGKPTLFPIETPVPPEKFLRLLAKDGQIEILDFKESSP